MLVAVRASTEARDAAIEPTRKTTTMKLAKFAAVRTIVGSDDVIILFVGTKDRLRHVGGDMILPIWYREDGREPRDGDRLTPWVDGSTRYIMA